VLSAFVIESKKKLEADQTQILVGLVTSYFQNVGNLSKADFSPPIFTPNSVDISINCLLFASLGTSLFAALASVVALQWVADYDAAITRGGSSPEDYARRRQFRYGGILSWKMQEIIAALPLLIYASVALFWAGSIQWIWSLHHTVGYVVISSTALVLVYYGVTTALSAMFITAPFRTPLARGTYSLCQKSLSLVYKLLPHKRTTAQHGKGNHSRYSRSPFGLTQRSFKSLRDGTIDHLLQFARWIETDILPADTPIHREELAVFHNERYLKEQALCWLAHRLPISADAHRRLALLLIGIASYLPDQNFSDAFPEAPWWPILNFLGWHHICKMMDGPLSEDDHESIRALLRFNKFEDLKDYIHPPKEHEDDFFSVAYGKRIGVKSAGQFKPQGRLDINGALLLQPMKTTTAALDVDIPKTLLQVIVKAPYQDVRQDAVSALDRLSENGKLPKDFVKYTNQKLVVELKDVVIVIISRLTELLRDEVRGVQKEAVFSLCEFVKNGE
jgi:Family of unknown function (DUF6535)